MYVEFFALMLIGGLKGIEINTLIIISYKKSYKIAWYKCDRNWNSVSLQWKAIERASCENLKPLNQKVNGLVFSEKIC